LRMTAKVFAKEDEIAGIESDDDVDLEECHDLAKEKKARVIDFLNSQPAGEAISEVDEHDAEAYDSVINIANNNDSDSNNDSDDNESVSDDTLEPPISSTNWSIDSQACSTFLLSSNAYRTLQRDVMVMRLPSRLREVMLSVPKKDLRVNREECSSLINKLQCWLHDNTAVNWYWWPLDQPKRKLRANEFRLEWRCTWVC
jgi:hypothetical protein